MSAEIHPLHNKTAADAGLGSSGGGKQYFTGAESDGKHIANTFKLAYSWKEVRRMMVFHGLMMAIMFSIEFAASFSANWASQRDGFGQFTGSYAALVGISLITACTYWVIAALWEMDKPITKAISIACYAMIVGYLVILLAPELVPMLNRLMEGVGATSVFAGVNAAIEEKTNPWVLYGLTLAAAFVVTSPGLMFIYFKSCFTKWNLRRKCHARADGILAISDKAEGHHGQANELDKVANEFASPGESKQHVDRAMRQAISIMIQQLQLQKQQAIDTINNTLAPNADKASASAEIVKIDACMNAARTITI